MQDKLSAACAAAGQSSATGLRISPPPALWEEDFFLRGLQEALFDVDVSGQVESDLMESKNEPDAPTRHFRIFSREPIRLLRENLCQLAVAARLIFERGWLKSHVSLEPGRAEDRTSADHFDLLVRSPAGDTLIWVEVRRSLVELNKLIADLRACSRRGPHAHADCGFPQNHPRHQFCLAIQPKYLWAVAPDGDLPFAVGCAGHSLELEPLGSLPPRSLLEFS